MKLSALFWYTTILIYLGAVSFFLFRNDANNWDKIPYMALVLKWDGVPVKDSIRIKTYENLQAYSDKESFANNIGADDGTWHKLRHTLYTNDQAFNETLCFYDIKPMYIAISWGFYKLGFPLAKSTLATSVLSFILIGLLIFTWLKEFIPKGLAFLFTAIVITSSTFIDVGRFSNPDGLGAALMMWGWYFLLVRKCWWLGTILIGLSLLSRPDGIILSGVFWVVLFLFKKNEFQLNLWKFLSSIIILFVFYKLPSFFSHHLGLGLQYYHTFVEYLPFPISQPKSITFAQYLNILKPRFFHLLTEPYILYFLVAAIPTLLHWSKFLQSISSIKISDLKSFIKKFSLVEWMFIAVCVASVARFVIYPFMWYGYWISYYLLFFFVSVMMLAKLTQNGRAD